MFCGNCGKPLMGNDRFCRHCGMMVPASSAKSVNRAASENQTGGAQESQPVSAGQPLQASQTDGQTASYSQGSAYQPSRQSDPYAQGSGYQPSGQSEPYVQGSGYQPSGQFEPYVQGSAYPPPGQSEPYVQGSAYPPPGQSDPYSQGSSYPPPHGSAGPRTQSSGGGFGRGAAEAAARTGMGAAKAVGRAGKGAARAAGRAGMGAARAAGRAKTYGVLCLIAVLLMVLIGAVYVLFIKSGTPEDTIDKLEEAMNDMDMDAMLECFDSQTNDLYSGALSVAGALSGVDLGAWADLSSGLGGLMAGSGLTPQVTIDVQDISYSSKDSCLVSITMTVNYQGETETEDTQLPMQKVGREWLISMSAMSDFLY